MTDHPQTARPLVLGGTGRVGRMWRRLAAAGHWPGPEPLWHARTPDRAAPGDVVWDMAGPAPVDPRLALVTGMIVLAGATSGDDATLAVNSTAALAALDLAAREGIGPVLLASSVAVYGRPQPGDAPLSEAAPLRATAPYGRAKIAMERAAAAHGHPATCLRIANVAGADALFINAAQGPMVLDRFPGGASPQRHMIGPLALARITCALIDRASRGAGLPHTLNVASPGAVAMSDILGAANVPFGWRPAGDGALAALPLDLTLLAGLVAPELTDAATLVAEARAAGWSAMEPAP